MEFVLHRQAYSKNARFWHTRKPLRFAQPKARSKPKQLLKAFFLSFDRSHLPSCRRSSQWALRSSIFEIAGSIVGEVNVRGIVQPRPWFRRVKRVLRIRKSAPCTKRLIRVATMLEPLNGDAKRRLGSRITATTCAVWRILHSRHQRLWHQTMHCLLLLNRLQLAV